MMCSVASLQQEENDAKIEDKQKETTVLLDLLILAFFMKPTNPISKGGILLHNAFSFSN